MKMNLEPQGKCGHSNRFQVRSSDILWLHQKLFHTIWLGPAATPVSKTMQSLSILQADARRGREFEFPWPRFFGSFSGTAARPLAYP
jgi:hypothetical protein